MFLSFFIASFDTAGLQLLNVMYNRRLYICRVTGLSTSKVWHTHPGQVFVPDLINRLPPGLHSSHSGFDLPPAEVVELCQIQHHTDATDCKHEDQKHCLLCRPGNITLHIFYAGVSITLVHRRDIESIQEVLTHQKPYLQRISEHHLDDVEPGNALLPSHFRLCSSQG